MNEYQRLIEEIRNYDGDTFFAKGCNLTDLEAIEIADKCIRWFVERRLDSVILDQFLYEIRGV